MTRTTPRRRTILHLSQIRLTDARTFISTSLPALGCGLRAPGMPQSQEPEAQASHDFFDYPPSPLIDGRKLQPHPVPDQHADEVSIRSVGDVRRDHLSPVQPHEIESTRKLLRHDTYHVCHQFSEARLKPISM